MREPGWYRNAYEGHDLVPRHRIPGPRQRDPVPLLLPLLRERFDPVAELAEVRRARPVARLDVD